MAVVLPWAGEFLRASLVVVQVFLAAALFTVLIGIAGAAARLSRSPVARAVAGFYVTVLRATPELLVLLIVYFGAAVSLTAIARAIDPSVRFVDLPPFWAGAFAISLVVGAYATETFRGAFLGVPAGQSDAALALGLRPRLAFLLIRLPQMWRIALPGFGNHMVSAMKDTALVSVVGLQEVMFTAEMATSTTQAPFVMYGTVAAIYLAFTYGIAGLMGWLERRAGRGQVRGGAA